MKRTLFSVLLLLAICVFSFTLTHEVKAQPVFDDPRFGCADTSAQCDTIWNTAQRTVEVPGVSAPCQVFVTYQWRRCGLKTEIIIQRTEIRSTSPGFWEQIACIFSYISTVAENVGGQLQLDEIKIRTFYDNLFTAITEQIANDFYNGTPPSQRYLQECGSGEPRRTYSGYFAACYNTCLSIITGYESEPTKVFLDHIPCGDGCCVISIETCWNYGVLVTTKSYTNSGDNCSRVPVPAPTCPEGEMNIMMNECFQFCGE